MNFFVIKVTESQTFPEKKIKGVGRGGFLLIYIKQQWKTRMIIYRTKKNE